MTYIVERREWEEVGAEWVRYWSVMQCRTCKRPTLREVGEWPGDPDHTTWTTLYPELVSSLTELPETVRGAWEEALLVRTLSATAFGVLAGRTLEAVCADKRAPHRWLNDNLKWLATEGVIPQQLYEMARAVQQLRNIGAHFNTDRITQEDVPVVLEFVDAVLEYVYRAPAKIATVQTRLRRPSQ